MSIAAGTLKHRVRFEYRAASTDDGYGNTLQGSWTARLSRWVALQIESGSEAEQAGRLQSTLRVTIKMNRDAGTNAITPADRVVFTQGDYSGMTAQIREIKFHDGAVTEMRLEFGVAE